MQSAYFAERGSEKANYDTALAYVDQAIKLAPDFSEAWALRSGVVASMAGDGFMDVPEGIRRARSDAEQAVALNPNSADGYIALGEIRLEYDLDWEGAEAALNKASALEPGNTDLLSSRANLAEMRGRLDEAIELRKQSVAADPMCAPCYLFLGNDLYETGQYDEANMILRKALDLDPQQGYIHLVLGQILLAQGRPQQALAEMQKETNQAVRLTGEAFAYHSLGRRKDSDAALKELIAKYGSWSAYQIAEVYAYRGENDKAMEWLERAYQQHDSGTAFAKADELFKGLRQKPRFLSLLKKMQIPQ